MKKILIFSLILLAVLAFVQVTPALAQGETPPVVDSSPLTLAEFPALEALIIAGISWIVTAGLKSLSNVLKKPLEGKATAITGAFVFVAVELINILFSVIPPEYQETTRNLLILIVGVLSMYGIAGTVKGFQAGKASP
jgi:hypothetical protein